MSFRLYKQFGESELMTVIVANSAVVEVGDAVKILTGFAGPIAADGATAGIVIDIVDKNGNSVSGSLAVLGSATKTGATGNEIVTVAGDNQTVDKISVKINLSKKAVYSAAVTGTMNTTNTSNNPGGWIDPDDENSVEETTHNRTITTGGVFKGWGVDPTDSSRMLVSIIESEMFDSTVAQA